MLHKVLQYQSASGAFPSYVQAGTEMIPDENCFITALVLLELLKFSGTNNDCPLLENAIEKGIEFLQQCEVPGTEGQFNFYPYNTNTPKLNIYLEPDLDDSALALLVLLQAGKKSLPQVRSIIEQLFEPRRIKYLTGVDSRWVKRNIFRTWINEHNRDNPADCCVNLNILSLYTTVFPGHTLTPHIVTTVKNAIGMFGLSTSGMRRIAPYYAHPAELFFCVERAIMAGVADIEMLLHHLKKQVFDNNLPLWLSAAGTPVCCDAHGRPFWYAPVLWQARNLHSF